MKLPIEERKQIENEMLFRRANEKIGSDLDEIDALHISDGNPHLVRSDDLLLKFKCECSDETAASGSQCGSASIESCTSTGALSS